VTKLESGKCYSISVIAVNEKGMSASEAVDFACNIVKEQRVGEYTT